MERVTNFNCIYVPLFTTVYLVSVIAHWNNKKFPHRSGGLGSSKFHGISQKGDQGMLGQDRCQHIAAVNNGVGGHISKEDKRLCSCKIEP